MTVYIDRYPAWLNVPRKWAGGGHLFGTDLEELHAFASSIGLKREWYQGDKKPDAFPHYDLTPNKRRAAINAGAVKVEAGHIPDGVIRRDPDQGHASR